MLYTINFSIEATTKDELQKICDDLVSDLAQKQVKWSIFSDPQWVQ